MDFAIGDLQGCNQALTTLLNRLPAYQQLWFVGDLVNRGPDSLDTLRTLIQLGDKAIAVLGNHDLHLLAVAAGVRTKSPSDTFDDILHAKDRHYLIDWLRARPLAYFHNHHLMVHAGVLPQWDPALALALAQEVSEQLQSNRWKTFLQQIFFNHPNYWNPDIQGIERQRVAVNALTRLRFLNPQGQMDFQIKSKVAPAGYIPWFRAPNRKTKNITLVFGHWSTLGLILEDHLIGLDTGCVWGGPLTAVSLCLNKEQRQIIQVPGSTR